MTTSRVLVASAAVSALMVLCAPSVSRAQHATGLPQPVRRIASLAPGSIQGVVRDEAGALVTGAIISVLGVTTTFAFTDREGRFELASLPPGPYLVRAYLKGYRTPRPEMVEVRSNGRAVSSIALRKANAAPVILTAGAGGVAVDTLEEPISVDAVSEQGVEPDPVSPVTDDETAWRMRHARRGVLRNATALGNWLPESWATGAGFFGSADVLGRAVATPARVAASFFAETPFSGEVNLLTAGSFDGPEGLLSSGNVPRGAARIAQLSVGAPVGDHAEWTVRGALTQADMSAWIVAGSYVVREPANHRYDVGMSYSAQRYHGGNPLALRGVADVTRNASTVHGFDTFSLNPAVSVTYGARYARYDYLEQRALVSPRVELLLIPAERTRVAVALSRWGHAPGAEEFLPPGDTGLWLPAQRTFSSVTPGRSLDAERAIQVAVEVERDIAGSTIAVRGFRQHVDGQLVTLFGADLPEQPVATLGHYFVGNAGDIQASGGLAEFRTAWAGRVRGSVSYSMTRAHLEPGSDLSYVLLLARSAPRAEIERIHDISTTIEADVPETATRVLLVYRGSNGFASPATATDSAEPGRSGFDYRFDVQVRQGLPFMSFSNAKWEMLLAVRNFFREAGADQSVYGELFVVRPPKRIVGGVALHF